MGKGRCSGRLSGRLSGHLSGRFSGHLSGIVFDFKGCLSGSAVESLVTAMNTQTVVLVSTAKVWISAPDAQTSIFTGFLGIHRFFGFSVQGQNLKFILWCLSPKLGSRQGKCVLFDL